MAASALHKGVLAHVSQNNTTISFVRAAASSGKLLCRCIHSDANCTWRKKPNVFSKTEGKVLLSNSIYLHRGKICSTVSNFSQMRLLDSQLKTSTVYHHRNCDGLTLHRKYHGFCNSHVYQRKEVNSHLSLQDSRHFTALGCFLPLSHGDLPGTHRYLAGPNSDRLLAGTGNKNSSSRNLCMTAASVVNSAPRSFRPYLKLIRADKPIGTWLLFWPCTWSISLATPAGHLPDLYLLALFGMGSFFMRGAGCIINDMWDKDYDKKVARTKLRPLASGELTSFQALCFLGLNLSLSLTILLQLNPYSVMLGCASLPLVIAYPLFKRFTYWPQAFLGLTLNWGVLLAWGHIQGVLDWPVISLYTASVLYTITYDSIYSHQDKYDDMLIGVKSTALKFGDKTKPWLSGFATIMVSGLTCTGVLCDQTWPYYLAVLSTAAHLTYQIYDVDLNDGDDCAGKFRSNSWLGLVLFIGASLGTYLKKPVEETEQSKQLDT